MSYGTPSILPGGCVHPPRCHDTSNPTHASTRMEGGQAVFENDNYKITAGDNNTVTITNKHTGECYQAWGDPHMKVDGQQAFDFWGTTTLRLEDGTKVTIETTPWANNPNMTLSSKVTITNGDYGAQISGIDTNRCGDLHIDEAKGWGGLLDAVVDDGNTLHENPAGQGFLGMDCHGNIKKVDQNYINDTDLKKGGAPKPGDDRPAPAPGLGNEQLQNFAREAFKALSGLIGLSFLGGFLSGLNGGGSHGCHPGGEVPLPGPRPEPRPRPPEHGPHHGHHDHHGHHHHHHHHHHGHHCHPQPLLLSLVRLF